MGQTCYPSESWFFKSRFSFKVRQHGQQQLYIQYQVCWILSRIIRALSLSKPFLCIKPTFQSPPRIRFSTSVNFYLPIPRLLVHKIFLTLPSSIPHQFLTSLCVQLSQQSTPKIFSLLQTLRTDTALIFPVFLKVWTLIARLTATDSLSPRLWKLVYSR